MQLISNHFMGESHARLSLVLMAASYINFTGRECGRQATFFYSSQVFLPQASSLCLELASVCYQVPCTRTAKSLYYLVMDCKQHSVLTCSNTSYLCHPPGKHRNPISATDPMNPHVSLIPAVNVTPLSDNGAWSQNRGRE